MSRRPRTLLFSTLYPSAARPTHGVFVETRLRQLLRTGMVETRVIAPVPWFPSVHPRWGDRAAMARTATVEMRHGIQVFHPRYVVVPKVGMSVAPHLLALGAKAAVQSLLDDGFDFDVIDAHYFYPDGVAAALLARHFRKPLVITARGSDVNLIADYGLPRRMMLAAGRRAAGVVGVSRALVDRMLALGLPADRLHTMRNGVDLEQFRPQDRVAARREAGADGAPLMLSVGNLIPLKGHALCIDALALLQRRLPAARLAIVGKGPELGALQAHAAASGVSDSVRFVGPVAHEALACWYGAADVLLLASSREGWPNVLLEAMACGTPVVATQVGGVPEVVCHPAAGRLVAQRDAASIADAVAALWEGGIDRDAVRRHAERFGWEDTSQAQLALFSAIAQPA